MNYKETMEFIEETNQFGSVYGLQTIEKLLFYLGNPQDCLQVIHIAGTNGKGSVLAYLSTILSCAGYKVGRYCSPTISEYRERIQINGKMIAKARLARIMTRVREAIQEMTIQGLAHPTSFEAETAAAFLFFRECACDIVVLETGMGGTQDATNIVRTTIAAVLTPISMDHMAFLGNTLKEIAQNKAGIIKNGCYVITAKQEPVVTEVIQRICKERQATLVCAFVQDAKKITYGISRQRFSYGGYRDLEITLAGHFQIMNAVLAVETIKTIAKAGFFVSEKALRKGLAQTVWQARFTLLSKRPYFIVDGAHNEAAAKQLAETIRFYFANRTVIYIMGILKDKESDKIIKETYAYAKQIITVTPPANKRAMPAYDLAQEVRGYHDCVTAADSLQEAVEISYLLADKDSVIIAFGSLSYLGELTDIIKNKEKLRRDSHGRSE